MAYWYAAPFFDGFLGVLVVKVVSKEPPQVPILYIGINTKILWYFIYTYQISASPDMFRGGWVVKCPRGTVCEDFAVFSLTWHTMPRVYFLILSMWRNK